MTTSTSMNDKELRKAWLKRKFGSFEYHEELVTIHEQWRNVLRKALNRAEQDNSPNLMNPSYGSIANEAKNFRQTYMSIIEEKPKPGDYKREMWGQYYATGMFRSIPDYGRYLISEGDALSWMTDAENAEIGPLWGAMAQMAENIRYTVDGNWDAHPDDQFWILDEEYTGPISWPANWRDDVADLAADMVTLPSVPAGQACPREGYWFTPAKQGSRSHFKQGEVMPDFPSDYGAMIWQWDAVQD